MPNYTVQLTAPIGNYPFSRVRVSLTSAAHTQQTQELTFTPQARTKARTFAVANGTWNLRITGAGFAPINEANINVAGDATNAKDLSVIFYSLHTDRDRNGTVDLAVGARNSRTPENISFGPNGMGAIIPVNCNQDGGNTGAGYTDNQDNHVNGDNDLNSGVAHLKITRQSFGPPAVTPPGWGLRLRISPAGQGEAPASRHFRIFDGIANNSAEILGPETVATEIPQDKAIVGAEKTYGIEAVRFAGQGFESGRAIIGLLVVQPEVAGLNTAAYYFIEHVMAARWIANHHQQTVTGIYVEQGNNNQFRTDLHNAVAADANPYNPLTLATPDTAAQTNIPYLNGNAWNNFTAAGQPGLPTATPDQWLRDTMVSGYSSWPGNGGDIERKDVFMKAHRWHHLQNWVYQTLLDRDIGIFYPAAGSADAINDGNSGGNISVTPPVRKSHLIGTTDYRFGRIYYGHHRESTLDNSSRQFLAAQNMQAPIVLNADWLRVGHVDEMMTFVKANNPGNPFKRWKLLVASPARAYQILRDNQVAHGNATLLARPPQSPGNLTPNFAGFPAQGTADASATITDFLGNGQAQTKWLNFDGYREYTYQQLRTWNINGIEKVITDNVDKMKGAFDLGNADIIKVPVIFIPETRIDGAFGLTDKIDFWTNGSDGGFNIYPGRNSGFRCSALTGDMPNLFSGNNHLFIPKPFGPWVIDNTVANNGYDLFEDDLQQQIANLGNGLTCDFIDDWDYYHAHHGEIHCGTNETRAPFNGQVAFGNARFNNWWTALDG
ncbi:protein-arginine deiminase family protein [Thalassospira alkalitolerans]|uniref:protein-arginine deiminase family protein n=1 Tax=Thalassospira alkalitolerans TaxID=1293890 RepID=UPI0030EF1CE0|tara:strand:- start:39601 stop:41931 length:2331 start_codon:yes stop_codon:yes gene_type:complete